MKKVHLVSWLGSVGLAGLLAGEVMAQAPGSMPPGPPVSPTEQQRSLKPRSALQMGKDHHLQGEYDIADIYLRQAGQILDTLSEAERNELKEYTRLNTEARSARQQGLVQMQQFADAINAGKTNDAEQLLRALRSNRYLNAQDRETLNTLSGQMRPGAGGIARTTPTASRMPQGADSRGAVKADPDALLAQARQAFEMHDYDRALQLARESESAGFRTMYFWKDTPAKVMKDAQTAMAKRGQQSPVVSTGREGERRAMALNLLRQAQQSVQAGDLLRAKQLVQQAESMNVTFAVFEEVNPEKVKNAIARAEMNVAQGSSKPAGAVPQIPENADPRQLVKQARQAMERGDLDTAEAMAKQARLTPTSWGYFEDKPDKLLTDLAAAREQQSHRRAADLLMQARQMLGQNNLDEAEKLANQSEALRKSYPIWHRGERPDRLRAEIQAKRKMGGAKPTLPPLLDPPAKAASNGAKESSKAMPGIGVPLPNMADPRMNDPRVLQADQMMAQARIHIQRGEAKEAVDLAVQVKKMNVGPLPSGDNPDNVLNAVAAVQRVREERREPQMAQQADATRARALQLLAQSRLQMREGRLVDAMQNVRQAQQLRATYTPNDDLPEKVMVDLQRSAQQQMQTYTGAAVTLEQRGQFKECLEYLGYVQQLATAYNLPAQNIAQQMAAVRGKMDSQARNVAEAPAAPTAASQGQKLLAEANQALQDNQLVQARKLGETLYTGPYDMKAQASQFLGHVDKAELSAKTKRSTLAYEQLLRAHQRKEFEVARQFAETIDVAMLSDQQRNHLQEILSGPEMQPKRMVQPAVAQGDKADGAVIAAGAKQDKDGNLIDEARLRQQIEVQRLTELRKNALKASNDHSKKGDLEGAIKSLEDAINDIKGANVDADQRAKMLPILENRLKTYNMMREQMAAVKAQKDRLQERSDALTRRQEFEAQKREMIASHMKKHQQFMKEGKFEEAYREAQMAMELDPDNAGLALTVTQTKMRGRLTNEDKINEIKEVGNRQTMSDASNTGVLVSDKTPVSYDKDLFTKAQRRKNDGTPLNMKPKSDQEKDSHYKLSSTVNVDFRDKPLKVALDELRVMKGLNLVIDERAIKEEGVNLEQPMTLQLSNHSLNTALRLLLHNARLTYVMRDGVIVVTTPNGSRDARVTKIFPVHDLIVPRDDTATLGGSAGNSFDQKANGSGLAWERKNSIGQSQHSPLSTTPPWDEKGEEKVTRKPYQTMEKQLMELITQTIDPTSWDEKGSSGSIRYYPLGMSLIVSQTPDVQEQIQDLLDRLRELQALQVTVEVRIVNLSEDFFERIGIDFDININDKQTNFDRMVAAGQFTPPGQLNDPDHLHNVVVGIAPNQAGLPGVGSFTQSLDIPINQSSFGLSALPGGFAAFPGNVGANGGLDMGVAFLSSIECYLFLEAVQGDVRSNIMQAPKITLFNGQTASISSTITQPFVASFNAVRDLFTGDVVLVPNVQTFTTGLVLTVQAVVSSDRRYVQLTLAPTISQLIELRVFDLGNGTRLQQPVIANLSVATSVLVPDGGTILLGGIKDMQEQRREFGVPLLSKLPYINRLFRNQSFGREANSTLFLVTPRIIIPEEEEERLGNLGTFTF